MSEQKLEGLINLNKPVDVSSARAVSMVKRRLPRGTKIGHAGTLDPFASGVLLLLVGRATRLCEKLMDQPKQYEATIKLGATTATDDPESAERPVAGAGPVGRDEIKTALRGLTGQILQRPPAFSALKVQGRRAYELARKGDVPILRPRPVVVYGIELLKYEWPEIGVRIDCGRGTYIRALARDLGEALGVGGYLTALCRTRVGQYRLEQSLTMEQLSQHPIESCVLPLA